MIPSSDKRLLWHPRGENKFVVGSSSQITLYEWLPETPEIRHTTSQHDLQHMKVSPCSLRRISTLTISPPSRYSVLRGPRTHPSMTSSPWGSLERSISYVWRPRNKPGTAYCLVDLPYLYRSEVLAPVVPYPSVVQTQTTSPLALKKCAGTAAL